jgi:hypothetical protein|tara:strand:+ start:1152 stop:2849 length:1698 start_codon:yes stop_codon:yes gene_type:complete
MVKYFLLYFYLILIISSVLGYGFLLANFLNKNLLKYNLGYIGILGLLVLVLISYSTIFVLKHDYAHNLIIHIIGLVSFVYFFRKLKLDKDYILLIILIFLLSSSIFILKNHDDFSYYHLTYSLGLTENKIQLGLGNFWHGYRHHSSLFYLNSLIFLPYIKYYLFHSIGFITLIFVNFICLNFIFNKKKFENFNYLYIFYLLVFAYINVKFYRLGEYGADIAAQLIVLILIPLILITLKKNLNKSDFKSNIQLLILFICYLITVKTYFIVYTLFLFLILILYYKNSNFINLFFISRTTIVAALAFILFSLVNLSYTGCIVYPLKETCFSQQLSWALTQKDVGKMKIWFEQWSKGGASPNHRTENPEEYIKGFNWLKGWTNIYFFNKGLENLISILFLSILFIIIFNRNKKTFPKNFDKNYYKIAFVLLILFGEWFYKHPALRYGGYSLLASLIFLPTSLFLSNSFIERKVKKKLVTTIIVTSLLIFNARNIVRVNKEIKQYNSDSFPFFYVPKVDYKTIYINKDTNIYIPINEACWAIKTPCAGGSEDLRLIKILGYKVFLSKSKK